MEFGWNWITERIALGGKFDAGTDAGDLLARGITTVLNCREEEDPDYVLKTFACLWPQPAQLDDGKNRGIDWFRQGVHWWKGFALDPSTKLYVHCTAGLNRSASMVYALLRTMGLSETDARLLIVRHRWIDAVGVRYAEEVDTYLKAGPI